MNDIYVVGVGMTKFGRLLESSVYDMVGEAVGLALKDAGVSTSDIGAAYYATATNGIFQGQTAIPGPIAMRRVGIEGVPVFTVAALQLIQDGAEDDLTAALDRHPRLRGPGTLPRAVRAQIARHRRYQPRCTARQSRV